MVVIFSSLYVCFFIFTLFFSFFANVDDSECTPFDWVTKSTFYLVNHFNHLLILPWSSEPSLHCVHWQLGVILPRLFQWARDVCLGPWPQGGRRSPSKHLVLTATVSSGVWLWTVGIPHLHSFSLFLFQFGGFPAWLLPGEQTPLPHFFKSGFRVWLSVDKLFEWLKQCTVLNDSALPTW